MSRDRYYPLEDRRMFWADDTDEELSEALAEYRAKAPDELASVITELEDELTARFRRQR
jgi:hypothetical protein